MTRFPGGLYAVALPGPHWAVLYPGSHIDSGVGTIPLPGFDIIEFDITMAGGIFKLAGKAQREPDSPDRGTWQWTQRDGWEHVSLTAHGTYPCIYTKDGTLVLADPIHNGSQGWRYVAEDGSLVTGDDTLTADRRIGRGLGLKDFWEYAYLGGVVIGQGDTGCDVFLDGIRRELESGDCFFIRVKYADGLWAVGMTKLAQGESVIHWLTRSQLQMLPVTSIDVIPKPVDPPPDPEPVPVPENVEIVKSVRDKYPTPLGAQHAACLMEIARTLGNKAGLLRKESGTFIETPVGKVAQDIICYPSGDHYDVLGDAENTATPGWSYVGLVDPARYVAVSAQPEPGPTPTPTPTPIPSPGGDVQKAMLETLALILVELRLLSAHLGARR